MRKIIVTAGGIALIVGLALGGNWLRARLGLAVPGPVLGMGAYLLLLATRYFDWSLPGAGLLTALIGAIIVPPLVGLALFDHVLRPALVGVAAVLVLSTALTATVAALIFRAAGGRG